MQLDLIPPKVRTALLDIYNEIIKTFSWRVKLISLTGSFANGESTLLEKPNGSHEILSDIEIFLLLRFWSPIQLRKIASLEKKFLNKYNIKFSIICIPNILIKEQTTLQFFDIYYNSKLIYGNKSELEIIPIHKSENIPVWEGFRLLYNRSIELLEHIDALFINNFKHELSQKLVYSCVKALLACCESILLFYQDYRPTYREKYEIFSKNLNSKYIAFEKEIPNMLQSIQFANEFKQNPRMIPDYKTFWMNTKDILIKTLEFLLKKHLKVEGNIFSLITNLSKIYPINISRNLYYFLNLLINKHLYFNFKLLKMPIQFNLFKSALYLLGSIQLDDTYNTQMLESCEKELKRIYPMKKIIEKEMNDRFRILKNKCVSVWKLMPQYLIQEK